MAEPGKSTERTFGDLVYDSVAVAAIGGSIVALFFLFVDLLNNQPLATPSLMGSVLFLGADAAEVTGMRLDMVALYTVVHFVAFGMVGAAVSYLVHEVELHARHPALVLIGVFLAFEGVFALATAIVMPGVIAVVGAWEVAVANLLAALGITVFLMVEHRTRTWERIKQRAHVA